jgi:hypothetical protein
MKRLVAVSIIAMVLFSSCGKNQNPLPPFVKFDETIDETIVPTSLFAHIRMAKTLPFTHIRPDKPLPAHIRIAGAFLEYSLLLAVLTYPIQLRSDITNPYI